MDEIVNMAPVNFFQLGADLRKLPEGKAKKNSFRIDSQTFADYKLPDVSKFCHEKAFAKVAMGWSPEGIELAVHAEVDPVKCIYPAFASGDSLELMIDTRDVKTSGYNTRFCHHFFFMPEAVDGVHAGEITRFRTEDSHELCDPRDLQVKAQVETSGYRMQVFIPSHCLVGFDPDQFNRLGFTYRINRYDDSSQHFSVLSEEFQIEQQPSLWASLSLVR